MSDSEKVLYFVHLKHHRVGDSAERPDGGGAVTVLLAGHVLGEAGGHNDHVLSDAAQLLDAEVHQPSEHRVPSLVFVPFINLCHTDIFLVTIFYLPKSILKRSDMFLA